ncbi:MAG: Maf family nucleotide pyrophosphatase [Bacteroidota bacterium]|nr:Maf family nucleotide pyrophosphatase [Bacteroidota bacterium]
MIELLNNTYQFVLASKSPRRQQLLHDLGLQFIVRKSTLEVEQYPENLPEQDIACELARKKAELTELKNDNELIITADTIVFHKGTILGKPKHYSDAFQMLKLLSNNTHSVVTGICLKDKDGLESFFSETKVHFTTISDAEIRNYIERYKPYDKAGAYGIQEWIGYIGIDYISGSYYNVVGLPVQDLYQKLKSRLDNN